MGKLGSFHTVLEEVCHPLADIASVDYDAR
jgi:hypothetical protein